MTLRELMNSSSKVTSKYGEHNYGRENLHTKDFGNIYYSDKVAYYNKKYGVLELRMVFGPASRGESLHVVKLAFLGLDKSKAQIFGSQIELKKALASEYNKSLDEMKREVDSVTRKRKKIVDDIAAEKSFIKGIIVPCTSSVSDDLEFADYYRPNGEYLYYSGDITLDMRCAVSCSCSSYRYTFAPYNARVGAHDGYEPDPYITKSKNTARPKLNINRNPGLCKHLMMFATLLAEGKILKGAENFADTIDIIEKIDSNKLGAKITKKEEEAFKRQLNELPDELDRQDAADALRGIENLGSDSTHKIDKDRLSKARKSVLSDKNITNLYYEKEYTDENGKKQKYTTYDNNVLKKHMARKYFKGMKGYKYMFDSAASSDVGYVDDWAGEHTKGRKPKK